jgi:hypothetical protein
MVMKRVINIGLIGTMEEVVLPMDKVGLLMNWKIQVFLWFKP